MSNAEPRADMLPENHPALSPGTDAASSAAQPSPWPLAAVAVGMFLASLIMGWIMPINDDDTYYLHTWWMYAHGYIIHRDFFGGFPGGFPGLWILLSPLAWFPWTPSAWLTFGRALIAVMFGVGFYLIGRVVRVKHWEAVLLGVFSFVIMVHCEIFLFRRAYFEMFFLIAHIGILQRISNTSRPGIVSALAGVMIGAVCMISPRGFFFLPIQPAIFLSLLWSEKRRLFWAMLGWILGGLAASLPTVIYLSLHSLWMEEYTWSIAFPATLLKIKFSAHIVLKTIVGFFGLIACLVLWWDNSLSIQRKRILTIVWIGLYTAMIMTPLALHYSYAALFLWTAALLTRVPSVILEKLDLQKIPKWSIIFAIMGVSFFMAWQKTSRDLFPYESILSQRRIHTAQKQILDWLAAVSSREPIVTVDPHHPMVVPDQTPLRESWTYTYWISHPWIRTQFMQVGEAILSYPPPFIVANPWPSLTQGRDLIEWLGRHKIITPLQTEQLRKMISLEYIQIAFPDIRKAQFPSVECHFGDTFWIRRDRFAACPSPDIPYQVQTPSFSQSPKDSINGPKP